MTLEPISDKPRRMLRDDVRRSRNAITLVRPLNEEIGQWQMTVARLNGVADRLRIQGGDDSALAEEAAALRVSIEARRESFAQELAALPAEETSHGRVADTLRALESVLAGLDRVRNPPR